MLYIRNAIASISNKSGRGIGLHNVGGARGADNVIHPAENEFTARV